MLPQSSAREAIELSDSPERLRVLHGVSKIAALDNMRPLTELSQGVYGFTTPWSLEDVRRDKDLRLSAEVSGSSELEIHKKSAGQICVVGYIGQDAASTLRRPSSHPNEVLLSTVPSGDRGTLASIPIARILRWRVRHLPDHSAIMDVTVDRSA
jgi:hypothetical protein